jgi:hypothetical protein
LIKLNNYFFLTYFLFFAIVEQFLDLQISSKVFSKSVSSFLSFILKIPKAFTMNQFLILKHMFDPMQYKIYKPIDPIIVNELILKIYLNCVKIK